MPALCHQSVLVLRVHSLCLGVCLKFSAVTETGRATSTRGRGIIITCELDKRGVGNSLYSKVLLCRYVLHCICMMCI